MTVDGALKKEKTKATLWQAFMTPPHPRPRIKRQYGAAQV